MVWRAGGGSCGAYGAGGGSGGQGSRGTHGGSSNQCIGRVEMHFKWRSISLRSSIAFLCQFFSFRFTSDFSLLFSNYPFNLWNTYFLFIFQNLFRAFVLLFTFFSRFYSLHMITFLRFFISSNLCISTWMGYYLICRSYASNATLHCAHPYF